MFVKFWNYFLGWKIFSMVLIYENYSDYIFDYLLRKILKEVVKHKKVSEYEYKIQYASMSYKK